MEPKSNPTASFSLLICLLQSLPLPPSADMPVRSCFDLVIAVAALVAIIAFALFHRNRQ